MDAENDALSFLNWDNSIALPVANAENKLLEEAVVKKTHDRNKFLNELGENTSRIQALRDHIKNVKDELLSNQNLLIARKNEVKTEEHMRSIAERENGRLKQEISRLEGELAKMKEKRNATENEIFLANQQFDTMKAQMKWDQQALEAWLEESAQRDEDAITLKKYAKEDEAKIKELSLRIEKLIEQSNKMKKLVDDETLNTNTVQVELDKTAEEFRRLHKERQELIKQWEVIIDQMQKRDNQIDDAAHTLMKMNFDFKLSLEELEKKRKFYEDQMGINAKLDKDIESLDQAISDFSVKLVREQQNKQQFEDELGGLQRTVERTGKDLQSVRNEISEIKRTISDKENQIKWLQSANLQLVEELKETAMSTLSAEENAKKMEQFFLEAKQAEEALNSEIKKRSEFQFKVKEEFNGLLRQKRNLEAELNGCEAQLKNLDLRISRLDHESLKQAENIYEQDFKIQKLERRMNRLHGEKSNDEQLELERRIAELKKVKEERIIQHDTLMNQYKRVEDETRKTKREIEESNKTRAYIDTKLAELTLHIDTAQKVLDKTVDQKQDLMVNENLKKLELNKLRELLDKRADDVLNLNKERIKLESGMKERFAEIEIHQNLLRTQLRGWSDELQTVSCELKERMAKVEKLKKRHEIAMISMAPPEGAPPEENSQAYYVIKAAQEKEELQREGDELDAKIKKAEKELRALENTLSVVNSNNQSYKETYSKAGGQSDLIMQKEELEQQLRSLADTYKYKRKQYKQLQEDILNMESAYQSMNNEELTLEEFINDKSNKIVQVEKDLDQLKEKMERAVKQLITCSRELRRSRNTNEPTLEEKDFKLRDLIDFNKTKSKELVDMAAQYPSLHQTINLLFTQANIPLNTVPSAPASTRSSRSSSRKNSISASSSASLQNTERSSSRAAGGSAAGVKLVNLGMDLPPSGRSSAKSSPKGGSTSKRSN